MPAASHTEKNGSYTNTQRLLQWHHKAVDPQGDARSELWFYYHLGKRIQAKLGGDNAEARGDGVDLGTRGSEPHVDAIKFLTWTTTRSARSTNRAQTASCARSTAGTLKVKR